MLRAFLVFAGLWVSSCNRAATKAQGDVLLAEQSGSPAKVALTHFRNSKGVLLLPKSTIEKTELLVCHEYLDSKVLVSASMFEFAIGDEPKVPEDLRRDMERRTRHGSVVAADDIPSSCRVLDLALAPSMKDEREFTRNFAAAKSWVMLWPTGMSADGKRALVAFRYGVPNPSWRAVYLLERRAQGWKVVWSEFPASD